MGLGDQKVAVSKLHIFDLKQRSVNIEKLYLNNITEKQTDLTDSLDYINHVFVINILYFFIKINNSIIIL